MGTISYPPGSVTATFLTGTISDPRTGTITLGIAGILPTLFTLVANALGVDFLTGNVVSNAASEDFLVVAEVSNAAGTDFVVFS